MPMPVSIATIPVATVLTFTATGTPTHEQVLKEQLQDAD
jgi:hypothetical protein